MPVVTSNLLVQGAEPRIGLPNTGAVGWWSATRDVDPTGFELKVDHAPDGSWIKGHTTGLPRAGIESALRAEAAYAKELVDFDPDADTRWLDRLVGKAIANARRVRFQSFDPGQRQRDRVGEVRLARQVGDRDAAGVRPHLKRLVAEGRAVTEGQRRGMKYRRANV